MGLNLDVDHRPIIDPRYVEEVILVIKTIMVFLVVVCCSCRSPNCRSVFCNCVPKSCLLWKFFSFFHVSQKITTNPPKAILLHIFFYQRQGL